MKYETTYFVFTPKWIYIIETWSSPLLRDLSGWVKILNFVMLQVNLLFGGARMPRSTELSRLFFSAVRFETKSKYHLVREKYDIETNNHLYEKLI